MTPLLFIICALALPPEEKAKQLHQLREYLYENSPDYSFFFSETAEPPKVYKWERVQIDFEGVHIWRRIRTA